MSIIHNQTVIFSNDIKIGKDTARIKVLSNGNVFVGLVRGNAVLYMHYMFFEPRCSNKKNQYKFHNNHYNSLLTGIDLFHLCSKFLIHALVYNPSVESLLNHLSEKGPTSVDHWYHVEGDMYIKRDPFCLHTTGILIKS